jgi:hypothetical protein
MNSLGGDTFRIEVASAVAIGDIIVADTVDGGPGIVNNAGIGGIAAVETDVAGIIGVAIETQAATGVIGIAPTFPGRRFEATFISGGANYTTPSTNADLWDNYPMVQSSPDLTACVNQAGGGAASLAFAFVCGWGRQRSGRFPGKQYSPPTGIVNPRVLFCFNSSVWHVS